MWPFAKRKEWEKLGMAWTSSAVEAEARRVLNPDFMFLRDRDYRTIPAADFEHLIFDCWFPKTDEPAFRSEIFDCDDFAVCFMAAVKKEWARNSRGNQALAFGYISAEVEGKGMHAFIWQLDSSGVFNFYEPQTGKKVEYKFTGDSNPVLMES